MNSTFLASKVWEVELNRSLVFDLVTWRIIQLRKFSNIKRSRWKYKNFVETRFYSHSYCCRRIIFGISLECNIIGILDRHCLRLSFNVEQGEEQSQVFLFVLLVLERRIRLLTINSQRSENGKKYKRNKNIIVNHIWSLILRRKFYLSSWTNKYSD